MYPSIYHIARGLLCIDQERPRESTILSPKHELPEDDCALTSFRYTLGMQKTHPGVSHPQGIPVSAVVAFLGFSRLSPTVDGWNPARIEHHLGCLKIPVNDGISIRINYQPQLVIIMYPDFTKNHQQFVAKSAQVIQHDTKPRSQFHHVCDIAPTVYEAIGIKFPDHVEVAGRGGWGWWSNKKDEQQNHH